MVYVTIPLSPTYHQYSIEELLFGNIDKLNQVINPNESNTRTYTVDKINADLLSKVDITALYDVLHSFNERTERLRTVDRKSLYNTFKIPKKSGGLRTINAPNDDLMLALRELKKILEVDFRAMYHTSAFAYVRHRSTIDAVKRHQKNKSNWFGKLDLSDFFGSTTLDFVMQQFGMIYPFSEVVKYEAPRKELRKALELAFLDGGLPQGTPISPLITNVMMIPIDHVLSNKLRDWNNTKFVYTRYADDFIISSRASFNVKDIENLVVSTIKDFNAPFSINSKKTRYGSRSGSNWNLGVMLNKDNEITVGSENKRVFKAMLHSYVSDKKRGVDWPIEDVRTMYGLRSYYRMVEKETIDKMIDWFSQKHHVDVVALMESDLR